MVTDTFQTSSIQIAKRNEPGISIENRGKQGTIRSTYIQK